MPLEMLVGEKKSDWYNKSIDVFSIAVTIIEFLLTYIESIDRIDLGLIYILEAALTDNKCFNYLGIT